MSEHIQIMTTVEKREDGERIGDILITRNLAACVQIIGPINSIYRWEERIEHSTEYLCLIKTRAELYKMVEAEIKKAHPYRVPEIIALPIIHGSKDYLSWIDHMTSR